MARRSVYHDLAELNAFAAQIERDDTFRPITQQDFLPQAQLSGFGQDDAASDDSSGDWTDALTSITDVVGKLATTGANVYTAVTGSGNAAASKKTGTNLKPPSSSSSNMLLYGALGVGALLLVGGGLLARKR